MTENNVTSPDDGVYSTVGHRFIPVDHVIASGERYTWDGLVAALAERTILRKQLDDARETIRNQNQRYVAFQRKVREELDEAVSDVDIEKSSANRILDELGLDRLTSEYEVGVTVTATLLVESGLNEDDLADAIAQAGVELEFGSAGTDFSLEDARFVDVLVNTVEEQ